MYVADFNLRIAIWKFVIALVVLHIQRHVTDLTFEARLVPCLQQNIIGVEPGNEGEIGITGAVTFFRSERIIHMVEELQIEGIAYFK